MLNALTKEKMMTRLSPRNLIYSAFAVLYLFGTADWVAGDTASGEPSQAISAVFSNTELHEKKSSGFDSYTKSKLTVHYEGGIKKEIPVFFHSFFRSGDLVGREQAGLVRDNAGRPIIDWGKSADGLRIRPGPVMLSGVDGSSILIPEGGFQKEVKGNPLFLITHFENKTWVEGADPKGLPVSVERDMPLAISRTLLDQNPDDGKLTPIRLNNIDVSGVGGVWLPCASSKTPWNSHLGSEEYEPDAKYFERRPFEAMNRYFLTPGKISRQGGANPYAYGFPLEVSIDSEGKSSVKKRYAMGRFSVEMGQVMPDEKTVYLTDDGYDVLRLMFVADRPRDLSSGTIYAAKWVQTSGKGAGRADLEWIRLGHAYEKEIGQLIDRRISFSDIFDWVEASFHEKPSTSDFKPVYVYEGFHTRPIYPADEIREYLENKDKSKSNEWIESFNSKRLENKLNYLRIKKGMEKAAAFLETRRYAALKGATTEFTKLEGQALNAAGRKLYTVASSVKNGMIKGENGVRPKDHIRLEGRKEDLACGVIYESDLKKGIKDSEGKTIQSDWVAVNMNSWLSGKGVKRENNDTACDPEAIAGPDNIVFSEKLRHLFIAEDSSGKHQRNFLWAYSIDAKKLSRILIAPQFSEISGLHAAEDINGYWYLLAGFQMNPDFEFLFVKNNREHINRLIKDGLIKGTAGYIGPVSLNPSSISGLSD